MNRTLNRPGYFPLLGFLALLSAFLALPACSLIPQKDFVADQAYTFEDGTSVEQGEAVYQSPDGKATANAVDPVTGEQNERMKVADVEKLEKLKASAEQAGGSLPPPFGWLVTLGIGVIGAGGIAGVRAYRKKQIADSGAKPKKKS